LALRFGVQIPELLAQRKFVSAGCHRSASLFQQGATPGLGMQFPEIPAGY